MLICPLAAVVSASLPRSHLHHLRRRLYSSSLLLHRPHHLHIPRSPPWSFPPLFTTMDHQAHHHHNQSPASQPKTTSNPDDKAGDDKQQQQKEDSKPSLSLQESIDLLRLQAQLPTGLFDESGHLKKQQQQQSSENDDRDFDHHHFLPCKKQKVSLADKKTDAEAESEEEKKVINNNSSSPVTIIVEGNIGAGKTTFLQIFEQCCARASMPPPLVVPEPINLWRNVGGVNVFQLLADDPKRWSFTFQSYVQLTMHKIHDMKPAHPESLKVMERSLFSAQHCFVENLRSGGLLSATEHFILEQWFKQAAPTTKVDLIVYLKSDPELVAGRIRSRARPEEAALSLEVLTALNERHEDWLVRGKWGPLPAPVFVVDANTPLEQVVAHYQAQTEEILAKHLPSLASGLKQEA